MEITGALSCPHANANTLSGGPGNDILNGGVGNDVFVFDAPSFDTTINDFNANPAGGQD